LPPLNETAPLAIFFARTIWWLSRDMLPTAAGFHGEQACVATRQGTTRMPPPRSKYQTALEQPLWENHGAMTFRTLRASLCRSKAHRRRLFYEPVSHGPCGVHRSSKVSPLAEAQATGRRKSERNDTTSESFSGHCAFGSLFRKAAYCASVDVCSVKSGVNAIGATSMPVSRFANVAAMAFASSSPSKVYCLPRRQTS
jgi:hypothetical protein